MNSISPAGTSQSRDGLAADTVPSTPGPFFRICDPVLNACPARHGQARQVGGKSAQRASIHESPPFDVAADTDRNLVFDAPRKGWGGAIAAPDGVLPAGAAARQSLADHQCAGPEGL